MTLSLAVLALNRQTATRPADSDAATESRLLDIGDRIENLASDMSQAPSTADAEALKGKLQSIRQDLLDSLMQLRPNLQSQSMPSSNGSGATTLVGHMAHVAEPAGELIADHGNVDVLEPVVVVIRLALAMRKLYNTTQVNAATDASLAILNTRIDELDAAFKNMPGLIRA